MEPYQRYDWLNLLQYLIFTVWTFRKITGVGEPVGWTNYLDMFSLALVYQLARSIPRLFVCLFYKQDYAKKLLKRYSRNSVERRHMDQERNDYIGGNPNIDPEIVKEFYH